MALIPLNQRITVVRNDGQLDEWGKPIGVKEEEFRVRAEEGTFLVTDQNGKEVSSKLKIYLNGLVKVYYTNMIKFVDENGHETKGNPRRINIIRDFSGIPLFTLVYV